MKAQSFIVESEGKLHWRSMAWDNKKGRSQVQTDESVTQWIHKLRDGDDTAATQLWKHFFTRLTVVARTRMKSRVDQLADEEDIALSAFKSFCIGIRKGRFPDLKNRDGLWRLLVVITTRKVADHFAFERRIKRNSNRLVQNDVATRLDEDDLVKLLLSREPTPAMAAEISDSLSFLLSSLRRDDLKQVALQKMEGFTNEEIAERMGRSVTTVERKLRAIRSIWGQHR